MGIYEALKRAEHERKDGNGGGTPFVPAEEPSSIDASLREKLIATYRGIESAIPEQACRVIGFVGARAGEGTSTLAREFAKVAARDLGKRVALIDAERGQGGHHAHFGAPLGANWEEALHDASRPVEVVEPVAGGMLFLGCLSINGTPTTTVIAQPGFPHVLARLRERFDLIVFDSPPGSASSHALLLAPQCDGMVLVIEAERTRWQVAQNLQERLTAQGGRILGVILNKRKYYIPRFIYRRL